MDTQAVVNELKSRFGDKINIEAVKEHLKSVDLSKFSLSEIVEKFKDSSWLKDLDGDGVQEGTFEEIKGKISGLFHKR